METTKKADDMTKQANADNAQRREPERAVFQELFQQIEIFLPDITVRDAKLLRYLYSETNNRITLQQTANQFQISRERVRQIRDRALQRLRLALKSQCYFALSHISPEHKNLSTRTAALYLNDVLNIFGGRHETRPPPTLPPALHHTFEENAKNNLSPNVGKAWSKRDEEKLISLWKGQKTIDDIATELGRRNRGIEGRLRKLGFAP